MSMRLLFAFSNHKANLAALFAFVLGRVTVRSFTVAASHRSPNRSVLMASSSSTATLSFLDKLQSRLVNSWIEQLHPETTANIQKSRQREGLPDTDTNQTKRQVYNGHYVLVPTTSLPDPRLILYSSSVLHDLGFDESDTDSDDFLRYVSGNLPNVTSWATPYALSIMGTRYTNNCPYGTGNGYGDGRAISIGEVNGLELQLKGGGKTPFHRGADGRAVFRSSIREFLASEGMHHLGVPTTRALSLVVSDSLVIHRPWYREAIDDNNVNNMFSASDTMPTMDDPRLASYSESDKRRILAQLRRQKSDPNIMIAEKASITCRVATSFLRIGHVDLFARRVEQANMIASQANNQRYTTTTNEWKEFEAIIWHACFREYKQSAYDPYIEQKNIEQAATVLLHESATKIATMVSEWLRVGFCQGNFNADNCLVGGRTMDYGPFGWMDEYDPLFAKWTGSGNHFGFMNQMSAAFANYGILVESVVPVIAAARQVENPQPIIDEFMNHAQPIFEAKLSETFRVKLGFDKDSDVADDLWEVLEPLMRESRVDYTVFWRELSYAVALDAFAKHDGKALLEGIIQSNNPFYAKLPDELEQQWIAFLDSWSTALLSSQSDKTLSPQTISKRMLQVNPKFVLREWMLVAAYQAADQDEYNTLYELYNLIQNPYSEGDKHAIQKYYRRAPDETLRKGGTAFMS